MQYDLNFTNELIVDNFAGGGGASIGIERATNRPIDIAINHDPTALAVHELNHPATKHLASDVFEVDPVEVCNGKPVGLAWFSPDCRHFSKAKGGKPVEKKIRGLAWVARRWAKSVRPRIIFLENVEEFLTWGPINENSQGKLYPDPKRKGMTFNTFNEWFLRNGYKTEWDILKACDYGAPTIRKRLFWVARCDDQPIVWPEITHGHHESLPVKKKLLKPYRTAAECIDFSIPCPSIFKTKNEAREYSRQTGTRIVRPLADATLKRVAKGVVKEVINNKKPFIVPIANYGSGCVVQPVDEPLRTITAWPKGGSFALCTPYIAPHYGQSIGYRVDEPLQSITAGGLGKQQLVNVMLAPFIARQFKTGVCSSVDEPMKTIMANGGGGKNQLITPYLMNRELSPQKVKEGALMVAALLIKYYGEGVGQSLNEPLHTLSTRDRFALVTVYIHKVPFIIYDIGLRMLQPHELLLAQGFPPEYNLGNITKTDKVRLIGNSVSPPVAEALVRANYNTMYDYQQSA